MELLKQEIGFENNKATLYTCPTSKGVRRLPIIYHPSSLRTDQQIAIKRIENSKKVTVYFLSWKKEQTKKLN